MLSFSALVEDTAFWAELRWRLLASLLLFGFIFAIAFAFSSNILAGLLFWTLPVAVGKVVVLDFLESLYACAALAWYTSLLLCLPFLLLQLWWFVRPALSVHERGAVGRCLGLVLSCFYLGWLCAWYFALPLAYQYSRFWLPEQTQWLLRLQAVVDFSWQVGLAGGLIAQFPVLLLVLLSLGWIDADFLWRHRGTFWLGSATVAMFLTPPDMFAQLLLILPLWLLYELAWLWCWCRCPLVNGRSLQPARDRSG